MLFIHKLEKSLGTRSQIYESPLIDQDVSQLLFLNKSLLLEGFLNLAQGAATVGFALKSYSISCTEETDFFDKFKNKFKLRP